jgi:hypothetical protein
MNKSVLRRCSVRSEVLTAASVNVTDTVWLGRLLPHCRRNVMLLSVCVSRGKFENIGVRRKWSAALRYTTYT